MIVDYFNLNKKHELEKNGIKLMRHIHSVFETKIFQTEYNDDIDSLYRDVISHSVLEPSVYFSNSGYQGQNFKNKNLFNFLLKNIPVHHTHKIKDFDLQAWININDKGDWNDIHNHSDNNVFLSGVLYLKCPENCGNIRLYDPRNLPKNDYSKYYDFDKGNYIKIQPYEKMILLFPPWLNHLVEPNKSNEKRVSIAFNVINLKLDNI